MKLIEYFKGQKEDSNFNLLPDGIFALEQDGKIIDDSNPYDGKENTKLAAEDKKRSRICF